MDEKKDQDVESNNCIYKKTLQMPVLPKPLTIEEKKYLLAVERGDMANVRRMIQKSYRKKSIEINCVDSLGRGALTLAIDAENLEMVELLIILGVETKDALLHAINVEFVEAVELLLEHEELIHKEGEPYSWQKTEMCSGMFTPDLTPLVLAAHRNNYEIIKILLDRGATLPMPHDIKCGCVECIRESTEDSLRFSLTRVNEYRALASPSLIALSSNDPLLTAFQLSWELRNLAFTEQECKSEYLELRYRCQKFAVDLLDQSRSSQELAIILNHDPNNPPYEEGEHMKLTRLILAIEYKQKKFVAHPNIQQLLAALWYEGVPGFRRKTTMQRIKIITKVAALFPVYCMLYMLAPNSKTGKVMRKPFMKFLIHASSYLFFLFILILVSLRAEVLIIEFIGTESMRRNLEEQLLKQRGNPPTYLELLVVVYTIGFIMEESCEMFQEGIKAYLKNMWNFIDFTRNFLYFNVIILRLAAFLQQTNEISNDPSMAYIPRENWDAFDPQLIAEGLFAAANVFSALKLVHLFSINPHLGPLQISLGRMVIDIVKFFFIYSLVLFAFACGLNQLLWYFADLERKKCYVLPGGLPDWDHAGGSCMKWRSFGNVFEASQSLFWASFGLVDLENFELAGIKTYTRFWGLLMFGSYSVINVIVLLNLLIAMMSNSYAIIEQASDTEWKFARTRLWMSYFEEGSTLPPPFNIFPTPKLFYKLFGVRKIDEIRRMSTKRRVKEEKERDFRYTAVMRALVWRYVSAMHRKLEENPVTEDDINEVKGDISAFRYELLEILKRNGMDVSSADKKEKTVLGKRMKVWERRLMKDFHVAPVATDDDIAPPPENEDSLAKFRRIARMAVLTSTQHKWGQVVQGICASSQIGRCNNRVAFRNQQYLQRAMEEAKKLVTKSPVIESSRSASPIEIVDETGSTLKEILKEIKQDVASVEPSSTTKNLLVQSLTPRSISPASTTLQKPGSNSLITPIPSPTVRTPVKMAPSPTEMPASSSKPQSPEQLTSSSKPQSPPVKSSKSSTPDFSLVIEPATPIRSRPCTPEPKLIEEIEASEDDKEEVRTEELIDLEIPKDIPECKSRASTPPIPSDTVISRPVVPERSTDQGMIPPPPPIKPRAPAPPISESKPTTPQKSKPGTPEPEVIITSPAKSVKSAAAASPAKSLKSAAPASPARSVKSAAIASPARSEKNAAIAPSDIAATSEENLIPTSPSPLRPARKVEEVKTPAKRKQPKTGWL